MKLQKYSPHNYKSISQLNKLFAEQLESIEVVGNVLPFKTNNYVTNDLINWDNLENDSMFKLSFPKKGMLLKENYSAIKNVLDAQHWIDYLIPAFEEEKFFFKDELGLLNRAIINKTLTLI